MRANDFYDHHPISEAQVLAALGRRRDGDPLRRIRLRRLREPGGATPHRRQAHRARGLPPRARPGRPPGVHRLDRAPAPRRAGAGPAPRVDGGDRPAVAAVLPRAARPGGLHRDRGRGALRRVAADPPAPAGDVPRAARGHGGAARRRPCPRVGAALRLLRRPRRGGQARGRALQRNRLSRSFNPLSTFFLSRSRTRAEGSTRTDGAAAVPVTLAVTSPRPWFTTMSRAIRPLASAYSPATATFMTRLV